MKIDELILASKSPRRRELWDQIGVVYRCVPSEKPEVLTSTIPKDVVMELSRQKASDVAEIVEDGRERLIIGSDTVVAFEDKILGKPKDEQDAFDMILMLSGKTHEVYTGVTVIYQNESQQEIHTFYECTKVFVDNLSEQNIRDYIATGEPMDKAGSYGIQGYFGKYVTGIEGDYNNVVGLPVSRLYREVKEKFSIEL